MSLVLTREFAGPTKWFFAQWYDLLNTAVEYRLTRYRELTAGRAFGKVLEIGGGTGANLRYYPPDADLTFVEPNPHMARRLKGKAARLGRRVTVVPGLGEALPFPDSAFDSVLTTLVLCMVGDHPQVIQEARRVLKPGGKFFFYEHVISRKPRGRWIQNGLNPIWRHFTTGCNLNRDLIGAIKNAGFTRVELQTFDLSIGLPLVTLPNIVGHATA